MHQDLRFFPRRNAPTRAGLRRAAILWALGGLGWALAASPARATKYAGETFSAGVGARALGMGGAATALPGDVTSAYWNPASLVDVSGTELGFMHSERFGGIVRYDYLGFARPVEMGPGSKQSLALTLIRQGIDNIPLGDLVDPDHPPFYVDPLSDTLVVNVVDDGLASDSEYLLGLSYAAELSSRWAVGATLKLIYKNVVGYTAYGAGLDVAARVQLPRGFDLGANLRDLTVTPVVWETGVTETVVPSVRFGTAWTRSLRGFARIRVAGDANLLFEGRETASQFSFSTISESLGSASLDFAAGAELWLAERVALRGGQDEGRMTLGASLRLGPVDVDYAFRHQADLDDTHRVGLRVELAL